MIYYTGNIVYPVPIEWLDNISNNCEDLDSTESLDPNLQNIEHLNNAYCIIGVYLGIIVEQKYMGTNVYPYFFETNIIITIIRIAITAFLGTPTLFGIFISPYRSYFFVQIFRNVLPQMLCNFYIFGLSKVIAAKFRLISKRHINEDDDVVTFAQRQREDLYKSMQGV